MVSQRHTCHRRRRFESIKTTRLCQQCVGDLRQVFNSDQQAAEDEHFVIYVQGVRNNPVRVDVFEGFSAALEWLDEIKDTVALAWIEHMGCIKASATDGVVITSS